MEEYLIYLQGLPDAKRTSNDTKASSSTMIPIFSSTTPEYDLTKRKGSFCDREYGKTVRKSSAMTHVDQQQQHQTQTGYKNYGFFVDCGEIYNLIQQQFILEKSSTYLELLNLNIFGSMRHIGEGL